MNASRRPLSHIGHADLPRRLCTHLDPPADTRALPPLGSDAPEEAVADWIAHVDAGRISAQVNHASSV